MTLAAQDYVGRLERLDPFQGDSIERLGEYFHSFSNPAKCGAQFTRTRALTVDGVVDQINE
jgi:hypothetical protein